MQLRASTLFEFFVLNPMKLDLAILIRNLSVPIPQSSPNEHLEDNIIRFKKTISSLNVRLTRVLCLHPRERGPTAHAH